MMTDRQLHEAFQHYGNSAKIYVRKCIGLLPEIEKRRIWQQKGFNSIFDYARMLAGLSDAQIKRALSLHQRFEAMPALKQMLKSGEVGMSKLACVASIATPENQGDLAEKVKLLPRAALETLTSDGRVIKEENRPKLSFGQTFVPVTDPAFVPGDKSRIENKYNKEATLHLDEEVTQRLIDLQRKGINVNELLLDLLRKREHELLEVKAQLSAETRPTESRYMKVRVREHLRKEHGNKCSIRTCAKPAEHIHHTQRFALAKTHDPRYLAPLCREHHQIAHSIDQKYQKARQHR